MFARLVRLCVCLAIVAACAKRAEAIPIFAQRYHVNCSQCHTAIPELNDFGNSFRNHGYRLPDSVARHGTTIAAIRYNTEYERDPNPGTRRFSPAASIVADEDIGHINAYLHYGPGAGGAPAAMYLGFLSTYDAHTKSEYRAGLFELPLTQSPGQRLDSVQEYGYFGTAVGQNDLALSAPRLGLEAQRDFGPLSIFSTLSFGEFKGAAYGGKPVSDGAETVASRPEAGLFARIPAFEFVQFNAQVLDGDRSISLPGRTPFHDPYARYGYGVDAQFFHERLDLTAQQWLGHDADADGADGSIDSSGGYLRLKYFATPHVYVAARYDAAANPFPTRTMVYYAGALVAKHARVILEKRSNLLTGRQTVGGYFTIAAPWPVGY